MKEILTELLRNRILITTICAWLIAQTIKVIIGVFTQKNLIFAGLWEQEACLPAMFQEPPA